MNIRHHRAKQSGALAALIAVAITAGAGCGTEVGGDQESQATPTTTEAPITTPEAPTTAPPATEITTAPPTTAAPAAPATTAAPTTTAPPATTPPTAPAPAGYTMPDLVGQNLQYAQDTIQSVSGNPIFFSVSHDLAGRRSQLMDSNWKVCTQNVPAGSTFSDNSTIDFGVVKLNESCP